jgi:glutathione S-transferase
MIRIYASGATRSQRVKWACEEVGAPYEVVELEWPPSKNPGYLEINPAGAVPAIVDGGVTLTESLAICEYVSRTYGKGALVVEPGQPGYYEYLELAQFGEATLQPTLAWARRFAPYSKEIADHATEAWVRRLGTVERTLEDGREFITAGRLTVADISIGFTLSLASLIGGMAEFLPPTVAAYRDRLRARPAYRRAYGLDGG